jgi:hypothetical protein
MTADEFDAFFEALPGGDAVLPHGFDQLVYALAQGLLSPSLCLPLLSSL